MGRNRLRILSRRLNAACTPSTDVNGFPPRTVDGLNLIEFRVVGAPLVKVGRTASQSRKKSRDVELDTSMTRTRKFALAKSACAPGATPCIRRTSKRERP